jgi:UDP-glucuronate 4-epimerase
VIDSLSNYYSPELKKLRITSLVKPLGGHVENVDLSDLTRIRSWVNKFQPDVVIHLAAQPGIRLSPNQYERYSRDNLLSFSNLFQVILETGISNFIYASSSSVYGNSSEAVLREDMTDLSPVSFYGGTKLSNEILTRTSANIPGLSSIGLRFFTVYGPYGRPDMAYFRLISQALTPYKFELYGDGSVRRDFTYVDDTVEAVIRLVHKQQANELKGNSIFNIGGGRPVSMLEMIAEVEGISGTKLEYHHTLAHSGDVHFTNASTEKLNSIIGFVPQTELLEGLSSTFQWASQPHVVRKLESWVKSVG